MGRYGYRYFQTEDGGANWDFVSGFPSVAVFDMKIVNDQVVIATHGRGVWSATIPQLATYAPAKFISFPEISTGQDIGSGNIIVSYTITNDNISKAKIYIDDVFKSDIIQDFTSGVEYNYEADNLQRAYTR